jgi:hypothetical protein
MISPTSLRSLLGTVLVLALASPAHSQGAPDRIRRVTIGPDLAAGPSRPTLPAPEFAVASPLPAIMLTGYWPPSNEALRQFSADPVQNPLGWKGANWEGRGYDVFAYFPEFTPPTCSSCGTGTGDLEVDYQDTTADFWPLADGLQPMALITFSRGFIDKSWELENNLFNKTVWLNDFVAPLQPNPAPPDASWPADAVRHSSLPKQRIVNAVASAGLGLNAYICFSSNAGGFLSEFIGYLGVWYKDIHTSRADPAWCVSAGHIHVGGLVDWPAATTAVEITLRQLILEVDRQRALNQPQADLGFGGPGAVQLAISGGDLSTGTDVDLSLTGGPPGAPGWLVVGATSTPTPLFGGTIVPIPASLVLPIALDSAGAFRMLGIPGGGSPATLFVQGLVLDAALPAGFGISNAVAMQLLP